MSIPGLLEIANEYCSLDPNRVTRGTVEDAIAKNDVTKLKEWFLVERIEFGTAGLRAVMSVLIEETKPLIFYRLSVLDMD